MLGETIKQVFSHRNGETEPPIYPPDVYGYFWFDGSNGGYVTDGKEPVLVGNSTVEFIGDNGGYFLDSCKGRWWGPIVPPWRDDARHPARLSLRAHLGRKGEIVITHEISERLRTNLVIAYRAIERAQEEFPDDGNLEKLREIADLMEWVRLQAYEYEKKLRDEGHDSQ
jgi:hypothetical protein